MMTGVKALGISARDKCTQMIHVLELTIPKYPEPILMTILTCVLCSCFLSKPHF